MFLTVEGFILPLTTQLKIERLRHNTVTFAIIAVIIGIITVTSANFQSLQLHFSSTDVVTFLFKLDGAFFAILVFYFGFSILFAERFVERVSERFLETEP